MDVRWKGAITTDCSSHCDEMCVWDYNVTSRCDSLNCRNVRHENELICKVYCIAFPDSNALEIYVPQMENVPAAIEAVGKLVLPAGMDTVYVERTGKRA